MTPLLVCVVGAIATVFAGAASANYFGVADVSCTSATYSYSTFPEGRRPCTRRSGSTGRWLPKMFDFTGPAGSDTLSFTVPNDGDPHMIEANSYSVPTDSDQRAAGDRDPHVRVAASATATASATAASATSAATSATASTTSAAATATAPPPPPPGVCTYTKGFYRNHATSTAAVIAFMGGSVRLGPANLTSAQAQAVLNATPGQSGNVTYPSNLMLNLAQQLITGELNVARGSTASSGVAVRDRFGERCDHGDVRRRPDRADVRAFEHGSLRAGGHDRELQLGLGLRLED